MKTFLITGGLAVLALFTWVLVIDATSFDDLRMTTCPD